MTKNWEENDYYDSDEDSFLDRTGECGSLLQCHTIPQSPHAMTPLSLSLSLSAVEEKRRQRMKRLGKLKDQAENYDSLVLIWYHFMIAWVILCVCVCSR